MRVGQICPNCWELTVILTLSVVISMGCGAVRHPALDRAREAYQSARQDPEVVGRASVALDKAWQAIEQAERVWSKERDPTEAEHLAYLAERRIEIARATARQRAAADEIQRLKSQR